MSRIKKWINSKKKDIDCYALFSAIYIVMVATFLWCFFHEGKSLIHQGDAYIQGYPYFVKQITYVKEILYDLLINHRLEIPLMDFNFGYGMDIIVNITKYPIALLGVFVAEQYYPVFYYVALFLLLYIAGVFFIKYCNCINITGKASVISGSLVYLFCGFSLFSASRYFGFVYYIVYLPLCLIGVEQILKKKKIATLVIASGILFIISWYSGYVISLLVVIYCCVRLFPYLWKKQFKVFFNKGIVLASAYLLGIMIAGFSWIPGIYGFLNSCRSGGGNQIEESLLIYDISYYKSLLFGLFSPVQNVSYEMFAGFSPIVLMAIIVLFINKEKKALFLKAFLGITFLFALIPLCGKLFNGGGNISNRWSFGLAMVVAMIVAYAMPYILELTYKKLLIVVVGVLLIASAYFVEGINGKNLSLLISVGLMIIQLLIVCLCSLGKIGNTMKKGVLLGTVVGITAVFILFNFYPLLNNSISAYKDKDINEVYDSYYISEVEYIEDDSFYRIGTPWNETDFSIYYNYNGTAIYNSLLAENVSAFFDELEMNTQRYMFQLTGLDGRSVLNDIFSVKYFVTQNEAEKIIPYGYELLYDGEEGDIYVNKSSLPIAYTFSKIIDRDTYNKLSPLERQEALIQGVVVDEEIEGIETVEYQNNYQSILYEIVGTENIEIHENNTFSVRENGGKIYLSFESLADSEMYLIFKELKVLNGNRENRCWVNVEGLSKQFVVLTEDNQYYVDGNITLNMGYSQNGIQSCTILFPEAGEFSYDALEIKAYPMQSYNEYKAELMTNIQPNISVDNNCIGGTIEVNNKSLVQFSVPYSEGWKAYIDGEETKIYNTDTMFMSILLESGEHTIFLIYRTPLLKEGLMITFLAAFIVVIVFVGMPMMKKIRKSKN